MSMQVESAAPDPVPLSLQFFTVIQTARRLGVHPVTVRRMLGSGRLRAVCVGGKLRVDPSSIDELVERSTEAFRERHGIGIPPARTPAQRRKAVREAAAEFGIPTSNEDA